MSEFLEERLPVRVRAGASYSDQFAVEITQTASGSEYRRLVHPFPVRIYNVFYTQETANLWSDILALYYRSYGMFAGFRVKALDDYTTNARIATPTPTDQTLQVITAGSIYQLQVAYGTGGTPLAIGEPVRTIFKPVSGTTRIAIDTLEQGITMWSVDDTTGRITFAANKTRNITAITQAAQAVVTVASHMFGIGESVHFSGVEGMTEINGLRGTITGIAGATYITVDIDTTAFTAYTSAGTVNTNPQSGEVVKGGCEFDIPCRFNSRIDVTSLAPGVRESSQIEIIELLNP